MIQRSNFNVVPPANLWTLSISSLVFLLLQYYKIQHLSPQVEYIWDNVYLWEWARNFVAGDIDSFKANSHHLLRWGNWSFAALLIALFSDDVLVYYFSTIIPSTLGGLVFSYLVLRYLGLTAAIIFNLFWFYDAELFRATFQLLPTGTVILPVALLLLALTGLIEKGRLLKTRLLLISVICFWIYGVKEPYLAFLPGVLLIIYRYGGAKSVIFLISVMAGGYIIETLAYRSLSDEFSLLGRVWMLVNDGHHINLMFTDGGLVAQQEKYFDAGLTMRWAVAQGMASIYLFTGFLFALVAMAVPSNTMFFLKRCTDRPEKAVAILLISFVIFTTFFVISFDPLRLGQPNVTRYVAINLPLSYFVILWFCRQQFSNTSWLSVFGALVILPFLFAPSVHRYIGYNDERISHHAESYEKFAQIVAEHDCVRAKNLPIVRNRLDMIPSFMRNELNRDVIENDDHRFIDGYYVIAPNPEHVCINTLTIRRNNLSRY